MLVNKSACAVRHAAKDGKGAGPLNHVKITDKEAVATDDVVTAKITLPEYEKSHPLGMNGYVGPKLILKKHLDLVDRVLVSDEDKDPRAAAILTEQGALVDDDQLVTITFGADDAEPNLPFRNADFPDIDESIPSAKRKSAYSVRLNVKKLAKLIKVAKSAGIDELVFNVHKQPDQPVRVEGTRSEGPLQHFVGAIKPIVPPPAEKQTELPL